MSASRTQLEAAVHRLALPVLILGAALISFSGIFVKLSEVGPTATGFYRMFLALPFFLAWMLRDARSRQDRDFVPRDRRALALALLAGLSLAADLIAWHWCLRMTTVATATLLGNTTPIWVAFGGFLFLHERFRPLFLIGLVLAMLGTWGLIAGGTKPVEIKDAAVLGLGLFTGLAYAGYFRFGTAARRGLSTAQVMFWGSVSATIVLLPVALATETAVLPQSLHGWAIVLGLSFLSQVLGQSAINWAMGHLPAAFSSLTLLLNPLFAAIAAWPILGEALTPLQILAGLGVIVGILLARRARSPAPRAATA
ncbi:MAG TPA: DMT family transporter [Candidatus Cybelea sp.]|nr:DMT family transporter [Candidatus Cybelea sp.]